MRLCFLSAILLISVASTGFAQTRQIPTDSHSRAALEVLEAMEMQQQMNRMLDVMLNSMSQQSPGMNQVQTALRDFFKKYWTWERLQPDFVAIYKESFTEPELRELAGFFRTSVGRKWVSLSPVLSQKAMAIGQKIMIEHGAELQKVFQDAARSRQ